PCAKYAIASRLPAVCAPWPPRPWMMICSMLGPSLLHPAAEVGLAFLLEGLHAFARFLGVVVQLERIQAHAGDAALVRGIHVERALRDRQRRGALLQDLVAPFLHFGVEL